MKPEMHIDARRHVIMRICPEIIELQESPCLARADEDQGNMVEGETFG